MMLRMICLVLIGSGLVGVVDAQEAADKRAAEQAQGEARRVAAEQARTAEAKLAEAQRAAALAAARAQEAAAAAPQVALRAGAGRGIVDREWVDPQDPVERFALLTPGGPLIVQATLTIDGQPFRIGREKLIVEMLVGADADKDGKTTWREAFSSARFTLGRVGILNDQGRDALIRTFDKNSNEQVEIAEVRQFLAQNFQGPTFSLGGGQTAYRIIAANGVLMSAAGNQADLLTLLDTDQSKSLDAQELAAATLRLKSRDADDNDVLDSGEISGAPNTGMVRVAFAPNAAPTSSSALLLGPTATQDAAYAALRQKYKNASGKPVTGCFPLLPQLFAALDKDASGEIEAGEVLGLNELPPHIELTADLPAQKTGEGLRLGLLAAELKQVQDNAANKVLELPGVRIALSASNTAPPRRNVESIGMSLLMRYDSDGNGYLEASEMAAQAQQFALFDEDGDGKAYPREISAGYARQFAPQATQVVANVTQQGNSLFQTLDANGDGRLGLREMRAAAERLTKLDKNEDQTIAGTEISETISVSFAVGSSSGPVVERPVYSQAVGGMPAARSGPEWFIRMDRNGDGDLTLKEFLGEEADFKRLDANSDGLLDPEEAKAAGK